VVREIQSCPLGIYFNPLSFLSSSIFQKLVVSELKIRAYHFPEIRSVYRVPAGQLHCNHPVGDNHARAIGRISPIPADRFPFCAMMVGHL